jgi:hypothetical protein
MLAWSFGFALSFAWSRGIATSGGSGVAVGIADGEGEGDGVAAAFPPPKSPASARGVVARAAAPNASNIVATSANRFKTL